MINLLSLKNWYGYGGLGSFQTCERKRREGAAFSTWVLLRKLKETWKEEGCIERKGRNRYWFLQPVRQPLITC